MGFFSSIKNAFHHPVDVNIVSNVIFQETSLVLPFRIELINKERKADITMTEVYTALYREEEVTGQNTEPTSKTRLFEERQPAALVIPASGEPVYYDFTVSNSLTGKLEEIAKDTNIAPENPLNNLIDTIGKVEQFNRLVNSGKNYEYTVHIDVISADGTAGYDSKKVRFTAPGEVAFGSTTNT